MPNGEGVTQLTEKQKKELARQLSIKATALTEKYAGPVLEPDPRPLTEPLAQGGVNPPPIESIPA